MRSTKQIAALAVAGALIGVLHAGKSQAKSPFVTAVPNAPDSCLTCHTAPPNLNVFGLDVQATLAGGLPNWLAVCALDSDNDGKTNGAELGDPCCVWKNGSTPAYTAGLSKPSDATSTNTLSCVAGGAGGTGGAAGAGGQTAGTGGATGGTGGLGQGGTTGTGGSTDTGGSAGVSGASGSSGVAGTSGAGGVAGTSGADAGIAVGTPPDGAGTDAGGCRTASSGRVSYGNMGLFVAAAVAAMRRRRVR
jgi:hypothetical protein